MVETKEFSKTVERDGCSGGLCQDKDKRGAVAEAATAFTGDPESHRQEVAETASHGAGSGFSASGASGMESIRWHRGLASVLGQKAIPSMKLFIEVEHAAADDVGIGRMALWRDKTTILPRFGHGIKNFGDVLESFVLSHDNNLVCACFMVCDKQSCNFEAFHVPQRRQLVPCPGQNGVPNSKSLLLAVIVKNQPTVRSHWPAEDPVTSYREREAYPLVQRGIVN